MQSLEHMQITVCLTKGSVNTGRDRDQERNRQKRLEQNFVDVFILFRDRDQCNFPLSSVQILFVSVSDSVSAWISVNKP